MFVPFAIREEDISPDGAAFTLLQNLTPVPMAPEVRAFYQAPFALVGTPGAELWATVGAGPIRGMIFAPGAGSDRLFAVTGDRLYAITKLKATTNLIAITGALPASMAAVRDKVVLATDNKAWVANAATATQITDADLGLVSCVDSYQLRAIFGISSQDAFKWSAPLDAESIGALDFAVGETASDRIISIKHSPGRLYIFQERTLDIYTGTGDVDQAFVAYPEGSRSIGAVTRDLVADVDEEIFWVDHQRRVQRMRDLSISEITEPALQRLLERPDLAGYVALGLSSAFARDGITYYHLTIPTVGTWAYNLESQVWLKRKWPGRVDYPLAWATRYDELTLMGSQLNGKIYNVSHNIFTDEGSPIERIATAAARVETTTRINRLRIEGAARDVPQGVTPSALVSLSHDNGHTWTTERSVPISAPGARGGWVNNWGIARPPGVFVRVRAETNYRVTLYGVAINEAPALSGGGQ